jgi:YfiR/HmsC-like
MRPIPATPLARWMLWMLLVAAACQGAAHSAGASLPGGGTETAVKAAFLYRIAGFVDWPPGSFANDEDPLVITVVDSPAVLAELEQLVGGRAPEGRPVVVRRWNEGEPAPAVHILFVGAARDAQVRERVAATRGPVLVITEQENGHRLGGVLNFVMDAGRVRFTASLPAADARGVRLSARLLAVALSVEARSR